MKYTYRDECIIRDRSDVAAFCVLAFLICMALGIFLIDGYLVVIKHSDGMGSPIFAGIFSIIPLAVAFYTYRGIHQRRRRALEWRRNAMETGCRYDGQILDAGMEMESESYETTDDKGYAETKYRKLPNYWIDVEYFDVELNTVRRFRAIHFVRPMGRFIGCGVDVYVWHEWSEYIHKDLMLTYIDTAGLN